MSKVSSAAFVLWLGVKNGFNDRKKTHRHDEYCTFPFAQWSTLFMLCIVQPVDLNSPQKWMQFFRVVEEAIICRETRHLVASHPLADLASALAIETAIHLFFLDLLFSPLCV